MQFHLNLRLHEKTCIVQEAMEYRFEKSRSVHVKRMWCHSNCTAQDGEPLSYFGSRHMKRLQLSASRDVDRLFPLVTHTGYEPKVLTAGNGVTEEFQEIFE